MGPVLRLGVLPNPRCLVGRVSRHGLVEQAKPIGNSGFHIRGDNGDIPDGYSDNRGGEIGN